MKGLELPINALVIIVIVIIVLLSVAALFFGVYTPSSSETTLQSATTATCMRVNPIYCDYTQDDYKIIAARMPVYDFDANGDGVLNTHVPDGQWVTTTGNDNLEMLCIKYYNCQHGGLTDTSWAAWYKCCLKGVCSCP
jgi:hypothetical protein